MKQLGLRILARCGLCIDFLQGGKMKKSRKERNGNFEAPFPFSICLGLLRYSLVIVSAVEPISGCALAHPSVAESL